MKFNLCNTKCNTKRVFKLFLFVALFSSAFSVFSQTSAPTVPPACNDTNSDPYRILQDDVVVERYNCSDSDNPSKSIPVSFRDGGNNYTDVKFYFSIGDNFNLNAPSTNLEVSGQQSSGIWTAEKTLSSGHHWVMATANHNGTLVKKCKLTEVLNVATPPVVEFSTCNPGLIGIKITNDALNTHDKYQISGAGGTITIPKASITLPYTITRANTGVQVSVKGIYNRGGVDKCITTSALINPPVVTVPYIDYVELTGNGDGALIKFKNFEPSLNYSLELSEDNNSGVYNWTGASTASDGSANITGLDEAKNYCFRLGLTNDCGNVIYSSPLCSSNLKATLTTSQSVTLNWNIPSEPSTPVNSLKLTRNIVDCSSGCTNRLLVNVLDQSYTEVVDCRNIYNYQLEYTFNDNGNLITSVSNTVEVNPKDVAISSMPTDLVTIGIDPGNGKTIKMVVLRPDNTDKFTFYRSNANENNYISIGSDMSSAIEDDNVDPNANGYCYKYEYTDVCDVTSQLSSEFCTVFLSENSNTLNWTPYTYPTSVSSNSEDVKYMVEYFDSSTNGWKLINETKFITLNIFDIVSNSTVPKVQFRVRAQQPVRVSSGLIFNIESYSNIVTVNLPPSISMPSAFTPNGDGFNDILEAFPKFIINSTFIVFDRWGSVLFETNNPKILWDGMNNNGSYPVPAGSYAYKYLGESENGFKYAKTGIITLIR